MKLMYYSKRILWVFMLLIGLGTSLVHAEGTVSDDPNDLRVSVYPNPSSGDFFKIDIARNDARIAEVKIYSALGDVVYSEVFNLYAQNQTLTLNPPNPLSKGVYMISIKTAEAQVTRRVIVRN